MTENEYVLGGKKEKKKFWIAKVQGEETTYRMKTGETAASVDLIFFSL